MDEKGEVIETALKVRLDRTYLFLEIEDGYYMEIDESMDGLSKDTFDAKVPDELYRRYEVWIDEVKGENKATFDVYENENTGNLFLVNKCSFVNGPFENLGDVEFWLQRNAVLHV